MDINFHRVTKISIQNKTFRESEGAHRDFHEIIITAVDEKGITLKLHLYSDQRIEPN